MGLWDDCIAGGYEKMEPLIVKAELINGFASKFDWCPAIEGILAWSHQQKKLGVDEFAVTHHRNDLQYPVEDLPLDKEKYKGDWWYKCSMPVYCCSAVNMQHLYRRFNALEANDKIKENIKKIDIKKGPYKNARFQVKVYLTPRVYWHVVGEKNKIKSLLKSITNVGAKAAAGFGRVRKWDVLDGGDTELARFFRPLPLAFAQENKVTGSFLEWGYRPPSRLAENKTLCVIPDARQ